MTMNLICEKCDRSVFTYTEYGCDRSDCVKNVGPLRSHEEVHEARMRAFKNNPVFEELMHYKWDEIFSK